MVVNWSLTLLCGRDQCSSSVVTIKDTLTPPTITACHFTAGILNCVVLNEVFPTQYGLIFVVITAKNNTNQSRRDMTSPKNLILSPSKALCVPSFVLTKAITSYNLDEFYWVKFIEPICGHGFMKKCAVLFLMQRMLPSTQPLQCYFIRCGNLTVFIFSNKLVFIRNFMVSNSMSTMTQHFAFLTALNRLPDKQLTSAKPYLNSNYMSCGVYYSLP